MIHVPHYARHLSTTLRSTISFYKTSMHLPLSANTEGNRAKQRVTAVEVVALNLHTLHLELLTITNLCTVGTHTCIITHVRQVHKTTDFCCECAGVTIVTSPWVVRAISVTALYCSNPTKHCPVCFKVT